MANIEILGRVKPNIHNSSDLCVKIEDKSIIVNRKQKSIINDYLVNHNYTFDKVFDEQSKNDDVYNYLSIEFLRLIIKEKKNVTFFLYGQTGSGKTHTILGNNKEAGFLDLLLRDILEINFSIKVSVIEIYNNVCFDILNKKKLIKQNENYQNRFVPNLIKKKMINNIENARELKQIIADYRMTGKSSQNDTSSRSHLKILLEFNNHYISLIDLAGCEKANTTHNQDKPNYRENSFINQSLFALKECIRSMTFNKNHIPFRRSELTKMLKESFLPNTNTYIMSTISQEVYNSKTTIDVLNYISSIKKIKKIESNRPQSSHNTQGRIQCISPINTYKFENTLTNFQGSPRFQSILYNRHMLTTLHDKEQKIVDNIIEKKTSKHLINDYRNILSQKKKIIDIVYKAPIVPRPPKEVKKKKGISPRERFIF